MTKAKTTRNVEPAQPTEPDPAMEQAPPAPATAAWEHLRETGTERGVRAAGLTIALILFAVSAIIALYSVMRIASIWFEARFVPIVQFVVAGAIMAACFAVLRRLTRR